MKIRREDLEKYSKEELIELLVKAQEKDIDNTLYTTDLIMKMEDQGIVLTCFKKILEDSSNEVYMIDQEYMTLVYCNKPALDNTRFEKDELLELKIWDIFQDHKKEKFIEQMKSLQASEAHLLRLEDEIIRKDKTKYPVEMTVQKTIYKDLDCYAVIVTDRSEHKLLKNQVLQSSKLASLGEMAASIAHEINNPLSIISGLSHLLTIGTTADLDEVQKRINKSVKRITTITDGLKKFSRQSNELYIQMFNAKELVQECCDLIHAKAKGNDVKVVLECEENINIHCDEIQMGQVLVNLIGNAIDAVESLDERWVRIEVHEIINATEIIVVDSGNGIAPKNLDHIFSAFYTTKEVGHGTGLGLSISKEIIETHGGQLSYELKSGHTSFKISIPRRRRIKK